MSLHTPGPAYGPTDNGKWDAVLLADAMTMLRVTNPAQMCIEKAKAPSDRHKQSGAGQKEGCTGRTVRAVQLQERLVCIWPAQSRAVQRPWGP